jgi:hypothetical protein
MRAYEFYCSSIKIIEQTIHEMFFFFFILTVKVKGIKIPETIWNTDSCAKTFL